MQLVVTAGADDAEGFCTGLIGFGGQAVFQRGQIGCAADGDNAHFLLVCRLVLTKSAAKLPKETLARVRAAKVNFKFFMMLIPFR